MSGALVFNVLLLAIPAYFVWSSFSYAPTARYIPLIIGIPVLLLQAWVIFRELVPAASAVEPAAPPNEGRRAVIMTLWMALFFILFSLLGAYPAVFAFVLLSLVISSGTSWRLAAAIAIGLVIALWILFGLIMRYPLYEGALFGGLIPPL
jgi:hypothetical protein